MMEGERRARQRLRDDERRRQVERLQDRADQLARRRERDREWRRLPGKVKASRIGWLVVLGIVALLYFSSGNSNGNTSLTDTNIVSEERPAEPVADADNAASIASLDEAAAISPESGKHADSGPNSSDPQQEPPQAPAVGDQADSELQRAVTAAFNSRQAERWMAGKDAGYAVPSATVAGCRNITISNDADAASSRVVKLCR